MRLILLLLLISCGKIKVEPKPVKIEGPKDPVEVNVNVNHKLDIASATLQFTDVCEQVYSDIEDKYEREQLVDDCVADNVNNLLDIISGFSNGGNNESN